MSPQNIEVVTALLDNLPGLIIAIGTVIASIASVIAARRGGQVLQVSNGHKAALEAKIGRLEERVIELVADRSAAAVVAARAAGGSDD